MDDPADLMAQAKALRSQADSADSKAKDLKSAAHHDEIDLVRTDVTDRQAYDLGVEIHHDNAEAAEQSKLADNYNRQADRLEAQARDRSIELERQAEDRDREASRIAEVDHDDYAARAASREADELRRRARGR